MGAFATAAIGIGLGIGAYFSDQYEQDLIKKRDETRALYKFAISFGRQAWYLTGLGQKNERVGEYPETEVGDFLTLTPKFDQNDRHRNIISWEKIQIDSDKVELHPVQ